MQLCLSKDLEIKLKQSMVMVTNFIENMESVTQRYSSFEQIESDVKDIMNHLEREILGECLEQYDIHTKVIIKDGEAYRHVLREEKSYLTCSGPVKVLRSLYRGPAGTNICPLELQAGIIEGSWTPSAARSAYYVTGQLSPYQGENLFKELGRFTPSKSALDRLSRKIGKQWDTYHDEFFSQLTDEITIPADAVSVSASYDGIMLPMTTKKIELKVVSEDKDKQVEGCAASKKTLYKEAACAAVCFYNSEGERLRTLRFGRMPEAKKKTLKDELSQTINRILDQNSNLILIKLADGARDIWRYFGNELRPGEGIELLDFFHASEHLNKAIESAYGKDTPEAKAHFEKYCSVLKYDDIGAVKVIRTLNYLHKKHPKRSKIKTELNYFKNNRHRMNYAQVAAQKLPIGSGVIEASCKTLITQRLKCSGMRWATAGGQGILTARSLIQSERFDNGWKLLSDSYKEIISLPENVVLLRG